MQRLRQVDVALYFIGIAFVFDEPCIDVDIHVTVGEVDDLSDCFGIVTSEGENVIH